MAGVQNTAVEPKKISPILWLREVFRASHFMPCVTVTAITALLAYASGQKSKIFLLAAAVLFGQFSVGWCNDYLDRNRDRLAGRTDKPIVSGNVQAATIMWLSIMALILSVPLSFAYGKGAGIVHLIALVSAFLYNFRLKNSRLSILTFAVSFGLLPVFVAQGAPVPYVPAAWIIIASGLLGVAIHFQNVIPDLEYDAKTGIKGFPHYFSSDRALLIGSVFLTLSALSVGYGTVRRGSVLATMALALFFAATVVFFVLYVKKDIGRASKVSLIMSLLCVIVTITSAMFMRG